MRDASIVAGTMEHARAVAESIRFDDAVEILALGLTPHQALEHSFKRSVRAWTWMENGKPLAMCGVATENLLGDVGQPWLLTTWEVTLHRTRFLRLSLNALERMRSVYPRLENWVDARYTLCVRWLGWLGFTVHPALPYGPLGVPFHRFEIGGP